MPILDTHISGEQLRMPRQVDIGKPFRQIGALARGIGIIDQKRETAKLEFDQKIEAQKVKNQVDTAEVNYKSQSKLYDDNFDPNITTFEEHEEGRNELRQQFKDTIESPIGQQDYDLGTEISSTEGHIKSKAKYNKQIIDNANVLRGQKLVSFQTNSPKIRVQQARAAIQSGLDNQHIENTEDANEELQATLFKYSTHDATYGDVKEVIRALGDKNDTTYGPLEGEMRKKALAFALTTQEQREKVAKINAGIGAFDMSKTIGKITTDPNSTPEDVWYAIEALPFETEKERTKAHNEHMNARVSLRTNNTTYRTMNGKVKTALGKYGTLDDEERKVMNETSAKKFLQEVKNIQDELLKKHLDGELNYGSYTELVDQLEPVVAQRLDEARGIIQENTEWGRFGDKDAEAIFENAKTGLADQQERVSDSFMNYHNSLAMLEGGDKEALSQYQEDHDKEWKDNSAGRENVAKQVLIEENLRDVNSAYKLFTTYGGSDNVDAQEGGGEVTINGVVYIKNDDGSLDRKK